MPRSRAIALLLIAAAIPSTLVACTTSKEEPTPTPSLVAELEPGEYLSTSLASRTVDEFNDPADALDLTITRDGNYRLTIANGCNAQSSPFHLNDGVMTVTGLVTTLSGCIPPYGDAGAFVSDLLSQPVTVTQLSDDMTWTNSFGEIVFTKTA